MKDTIFSITVIVLTFSISIYNLLIAISGLFPTFRATSVGTLQKTRTQRNVRARYGRIPVVTNYTYSYTVNGKKYTYRSSIHSTKSRLYKKVTMVYVKWFPRYAYPEKFTPIPQWCIGISLLLIGIMFVIAMVTV